MMQHLRQLCWWLIDRSGRAIAQEVVCRLVLRGDIFVKGSVRGWNWCKIATQDAWGRVRGRRWELGRVWVQLWKNKKCCYLFIVLGIVKLACLLAWCVFNSDGSLPVKRTGPGSFELTAPMPRLELLIHDLWWYSRGAIVWGVILGWGGQQPGMWRQSYRSSVMGHGRILVSAGRTWDLLGIITPCQVQMRGVDHFFIIIASVEISAWLVPGIMIKTSTWEGWRSIANKAGLIRELLARWAVVGRIRVFRVVILRSSVVSIMWERRSLW